MDDYFDVEFVCLNEEEGYDCEYPFCDCERIMMEEYVELPDLFEILENGELPNDTDDEDM